MKNKIQTLMREKGLDAILISGAREHNPSMTYFVGDVFFTDADVLVLKDQEPILFYRIMERDCASQTGMRRVCYDELPKKKYLDCGTRAVQLIGMFNYVGLTEGKVALCGRIEFDTAFEAVEQLREKFPRLTFCGGIGDEIIHEARFQKDEKEVEEIRKMSKIVTTVAGRVESYIAAQHLRGGILLDENENPVTIGKVKSLINLWLGELGAENPEGTIFSQGRDAGVPHSQGNDEEPLMAGKSIVFDFFPCGMGGGYFSDFTRTWCIGFAPLDVMETYAQVKEIHDLLIERIRSGMKYRELQQLTCNYFKNHGHQTIDDFDQVTNGYGHSVGHGLGLNIHERPFSSKKSPDKDQLLPGTVFTIEPGLYYPDDPKGGYGVRIEDTYYLNPAGEAECLTDYPYRLVIDVPVKK